MKTTPLYISIFLLFLISGCAGNGTENNTPSDAVNNSEQGTDGSSEDNPADRSSITQYGITWTFDREYPSGQFVNGDFWVVGPVTIIQIDPPTYVNNQSHQINGSMINPYPLQDQGYGGTYQYNEDLNVARTISGTHPLALDVESSLISTIFVDNYGDFEPQIKTAAILTCLSEEPPAHSFRPGYSDPNKAIYSYNDVLDTIAATPNILKRLPLDNNPYELSEVERKFERPWLDHIPTLILHPAENMPGYGRYIAIDVSIGALFLHLDYPFAEKETLLKRYIQLGIDLYSIARNGGQNTWAPDGGHQAGRKWPILFAGIMLNNNDMKNIGPGNGGQTDETTGHVQFQEDGQTWYVDDYAVYSMQPYDGIHLDPEHYKEPRSGIPYGGYLAEDIGMPEWGGVHSKLTWGRTGDARAWNAFYRRSCTADVWRGFVLAAIIMEHDTGAKTLWSHDALFDYMDRYHDIEENIASPDGSDFSYFDLFSKSMWDTYRDNYPKNDISRWVKDYYYQN